MKKHSLFFLLSLASASLNAQQLEVIPAAGDFHLHSSGSLSWTLGEAVIETLVSDNFTLTQGFQQSKLTVTAIDVTQIPGIKLSVYPNPASNFLFVEILSDRPGDLQLRLFDLNGKLLLLKKVTESIHTVQMQHYTPAIYILVITSDGKTIQTYQIVKQ